MKIMSLLWMTFHYGVIIYLTFLWIALFTLVSVLLLGFVLCVLDRLSIKYDL